MASVIKYRGQNDPKIPPIETMFDPKEDVVRQEFKEEADLEYQVRRFGAGRPFQTGFVDYTTDLTLAYQLIHETRQAWRDVPAVLREKYSDWPSLEAALESGEAQELLKPAAPAEVPSAGAGGSASGSAPVPPPQEV